MRHPTSLSSMLAVTYDEDRDRGVDRRNAHHRALLASGAVRPSRLARLVAGIAHGVRGDRHSLTDYACRLPDGKIGRVAVLMQGGEWTLVCRVA
jgi:hypothetical protein